MAGQRGDETGIIASQTSGQLPQDGEDTGHFADGSNLVSDNLFADGSCFPLPENVISLCENGTRHDRMHSKNKNERDSRKKIKREKTRDFFFFSSIVATGTKCKKVGKRISEDKD